ncbi:SDR family NAD(P)-dependent oxidoreductase [Promicromonospora sp. NPDC023987]|uniref:SDR family NAD(P)-dependent oxidoreductase n=1 Tax=Promicromonospora sp. NPDC023987 TaxID=3155360 RepID=UPI0033CEF2A3
MATTVITGGTNGIGAALAGRLVQAGHRVLVVGRSAAAPAGAELVQADLSTLAGTAQAADEIAERTSGIDGLVLGAGRFNRRRTLTPDGLEQTFALHVVSRYLLTDLLVSRLTSDAVMVSLCGVAGLGGPGIRWDDLNFGKSYRPFAAVSQVARASDLLGAGFHDRYASVADQPAGSAARGSAGGLRYVLHNPMFVDSGLGRQVGGMAGKALDGVARVLGQPTDKAAALVEPFVRDAGATVGPLTVSRRGVLLGVDRPELDRTAAARLYGVLETLTVANR